MSEEKRVSRVERIVECDFLIIGSGAAAMSAALTASVNGLRVLVLEKDENYGGATARSGGCVWIPNSPHAASMGFADSREEAHSFLRHEAGARFDPETVSAFLDNGPEMLSFVEKHSPVRFAFLAGFPDYHCDSPGGSRTGRALYPESWDAEPLGREVHRLREPLQTGTILGMQIGVNEVGYYTTANRKLNSALYVAKCVARRIRDQFRGGRTFRLAAGNALIGGLWSAAFKLGARLWTSSPARALILSEGQVKGALVDSPEGLVEVRARWGVMIATGGFPHDSAVRAKLFPNGAKDPEVWNMFPYGNSGDGIRMAQAIGAHFETDTKSPIAFSPIMRLRNVEGALETMPAFFNRGMPGVIAVTRNGKRFCNEGRSYHDFCVNLLKVTPDGEEPVAWLIFDHRVLLRYGMGPIYPWPMPYKQHIRSGFLKRGSTFAELAREAGLNPENLEATVMRYNANARFGDDPEFQRGSNAFDVANGDPEQGPNPCIGPLDKPPYYAIRVFAGCVGTFAGLQTDGHGRVLDQSRTPISGLYAGGNDMLSITGGDYVAGGCTLGPGMTFGYIVGQHVSARSQQLP